VLTTGNARAWYFPEHTVISQDGIAQLPLEARDVIRAAVIEANREGLKLCDTVDLTLERAVQNRPLKTKMIQLEKSVDCVPYAALSALAGDHSDSAVELRRVLLSDKGIEIVSAAAFEWRRFLHALEQLPNTPVDRMPFVHALDVAFYFIDPGYELRAQATRAHFADAGRPLRDLVRESEAGKIDNALGQFLAHHVRSLSLAARGSTSEAILEHGFALHFLQDSFAAGHLIQAGWAIENDRQRQRHDFYNAKGLAVGRATAVESCNTLGVGSLEFAELPPCWVTTGDGFLGTSSDASDRLHVARATAKVELQFALALDPKRMSDMIEAFGEREQIAFGQLLEPTPWWTISVRERHDLNASGMRTRRLVRGAVAALDRLRTGPPTPLVEVGKPTRSPLFAPDVLSHAFEPCAAERDVDPALASMEDSASCGPSGVLALGSVGASLLRPVLVDWPTPQAPVDSLTGEAKRDLGWAVQLLAAVNTRVLVPSGANVDFFAPSVGVSGGLSYRWGTYLPGRLNRSVIELNAGISDALHFDSGGHAGGFPHVTLLHQELRWPILYEILTSYALPLDVAKGHAAGHVLLLSGVRVHELLRPEPVFWGFEVEALSIALTSGRGAHPLYAASPEIRFYVGLADPNVAQPSLPSGLSPTVGLALTGGYATFL
jgi:hypothetical protein